MKKKASTDPWSNSDHDSEEERADGPTREGDAGSNDNEHEQGSPGEGPAKMPEGARKFDPSRLRLSSNFASLAGVKKHVLVVPIRKPTKFEWVQFHPDEDWRIDVATLVWKEERETHYVVDPELWPSLSADIVPTVLITTVSTQGAVFLTPIRLPGQDGRQNEWHRSLLDAAHHGMKGAWIRIAANMSIGGYDVYSAPGDLGPASWPATPFPALLEISLRDRMIESREHPILKRLRGES